MLLAGPSVEARRGLSDAKSDPPDPHFHRPTNLGTEGLKPVAGFPDISLQGVSTRGGPRGPRTTERRMSGRQPHDRWGRQPTSVGAAQAEMDELAGARASTTRTQSHNKPVQARALQHSRQKTPAHPPSEFKIDEGSSRLEVWSGVVEVE